VPPCDLAIGIVHLGMGAFHRAHQAVLTEDAMAVTGDHRWGICAVTQRSAVQRDLLVAQEGLCSMLVRQPSGSTARVVGALRRVLDGTREEAEVAAALADPAVRVVTITVTERGYRVAPATGELLADDPDVAADAAGLAPAQTLVGRLAEGLEERRRRGSGPITVVSCDNLPGNGRLLAAAMRDFLELAGDRYRELRAWSADYVAFPSTMVDRLVPAADEADRATVSELLGVDDRAVVVTEPEAQWVIQDHFTSERPEWEAAGARIVPDVEPFEVMKLRMLNGSHTALAYLGLLSGERSVAGAIAAPTVRHAVEVLMDELSRSLVIPPGVDLADYRASLMRRFENSALPDRLERIASDGSQKLRPRLLAAAGELKAAGIRSVLVPIVFAAWAVALIREADHDGRSFEVRDPLPRRPRRTADPVEIQAGVDALLGRADIVPSSLLGDREFASDVRRAATVLLGGPTRSALITVLESSRR